jgi:hypothetical protein
MPILAFFAKILTDPVGGAPIGKPREVYGQRLFSVNSNVSKFVYLIKILMGVRGVCWRSR